MTLKRETNMAASPMLNAETLTLHWHDNSSAVYSLDFQPNRTGKKSARLATGGGDNNVRIWSLKYDESETKIKSVEYLSTLAKHTQAVNCVRFDPTGEFLATASDDGTVIVWAMSEKITREFGNSDHDIKESWYLKTACRSSPPSEIYDISWSPDSRYICCGSMDNIVRFYNVSNGSMIKQIAEHHHYVQGVTWDPRNEFICSQSADRSVHIYKILSEHGNDLNISPTTFYKISRAELPVGRLPPAPTTPTQSQLNLNSSSNIYIPQPIRLTSENLTKNNSESNVIPAILMSATSTTSTMDPPPQTPRHKRTYSNSSTSSISRCASPLPAVMPPSSTAIYKNYHLYHNETLQSFFRRLSFSPDGMLLFTASGIYKTPTAETNSEELTNTVYIHTRYGLNKSPVAHLPGLKKPAIAIRFSPVLYKSIESAEVVFKMPYRMIFVVATQDSVLIYDTQRLRPLGVVSNIHYAVITDACWSSDGKTLMISSADGFVSTVVVNEELLGEVETYDVNAYLKEHPLVKPEFRTTLAAPELSRQDESRRDSTSSVTSNATVLDNPIKRPSAGSTPSILEMLGSASTGSTTTIGTPVINSPKPNKMITTMEVIDITDVEDNESVKTPATPATELDSPLLPSFSQLATPVSSKPERKKLRIQPTLITSGLVKQETKEKEKTEKK